MTPEKPSFQKIEQNLHNAEELEPVLYEDKDPKQKEEDLGRLDEISNKVKTRQELTIEDLRFLYELDKYTKDMNPWYEDDGEEQWPSEIDEKIKKTLKNILARRADKHADLSLLTGVPAEQISLNEREALTGNIKLHYGDLDLSQLTTHPMPKRGGPSRWSDHDDGFVITDLQSMTSAGELKLPERITGDLLLNKLTSAKGLILPDSVGGDLDLSGLTSAEGLRLPDSVGGDLDLSRLTSAEGLRLPDSVGGDLDLSRLTSVEGLKLPDRIGEELFLEYLPSAERAKLIKEYPKFRITKWGGRR